MNVIPKEKLPSVFEKYWNSAKYSFFKLETLQEYNDDTDWEAYKEFKNGDIETAEKIIQEEFSQEEKSYSALLIKGVEITRYHIVNRPFTQYIKFELLTYKYSKKLGEKIYLIDNKLLDPKDSKIIDFVMFDEKNVIENHFDSNNNLDYSTLIQEKKHTSKYVELKNTLQKLAVPFEEYR